MPEEPRDENRGTPSGDTRLMRLLRAQRRQADDRGAMARGTPEWDTATDELDTINAQLMRLATSGTMALEALGNGVDLDLDSRPENDALFRSSVLDSIRRTVRARTTEDLGRRTLDRVAASDDAVSSTLALIQRAEDNLRVRYPAAVLTAGASGELMILMLASRDGDAA